MKLLPRKEFEITVNGVAHKGKFGTYATKLFCDRRGIKLSELQNIFPEGADLMDILDDVIGLILCAMEYSAGIERKPFDLRKVDIYAAIDDKQFKDGELMKVLNHSGDPETKNGQEESQPNGLTSNDGSTPQEEPLISSGT